MKKYLKKLGFKRVIDESSRPIEKVTYKLDLDNPLFCCRVSIEHCMDYISLYTTYVHAQPTSDNERNGAKCGFNIKTGFWTEENKDQEDFAIIINRIPYSKESVKRIVKTIRKLCE